MSEQPNIIMLKGAQNQLKIVRVTSKLSHWDLRLKYSKQSNNMQEYTEDNQEYSNLQEYAKTNMQEHIEDIHAELDTTNLPIEVNNLQECTETHMQEYTEDRCDELDTTNQCTEVNNLQEYTETDLQEYTEGIHELNTTNHIEVKNEIIEELGDSSNSVQVKEEVTSDLDIDDCEFDVDDTEPKDNFPNIKIEKELRESEHTEPVYGKVDEIMKGCKIFDIIPKSNKEVDEVPNHYENVDGVPEHFNTVKNIPNTDEFPTLKCTVCFKAFLGEEAYDDHMKKHTNIECSPDEGNPSSVLKIGKPASSKCTLLKSIRKLVKKIREKRLKIKTRSYSARKVDDSRNVQNNSDSNYSVQNDDFDSPTIKVEDDDDSSDTVKVDDDNENNAVKVGIDNDISDIKIENEDLLVERQNDIHFDSPTIKVELDDDSSNTFTVDDDNDLSNTVKVDDNNENNTVKVDVDSDISDTKTENKDLLIERQNKKPMKVRGKKVNRCRTPLTVVYKKYDENCDKNKKMKSFGCNMCDYKCVQRCHLDQHMRIHLSDKPFSCNFCDYECVQRSQLDQHVRTHTRVRPFTCNFCDYTCTQRSHLDQHMRRHTGMRPFRCIFCGYTCVQRSHLNRHIMNTHRNVHVFKCYRCNYRCLYIELLAKHMNNHNIDTA